MFPLTEEAFRPCSRGILLYHVDMHHLANRYLLTSLKEASLSNLHRVLCFADRSTAMSNAIIGMLRHVYDKPSCSNVACEDPLRQMVAHYAVANADVLSKHDDFRDLLSEYGELSSDMVHLMLK